MRLLRTVTPLALACLLCTACSGGSGLVHAELSSLPDTQDALAVSDALEALIADDKDTPADREHAHDRVTGHEEATAEYAFARAAVTGRLVQQRGMRAAHLVTDVERWAMRSIELDPRFRDEAATRMLGTLYVLAPAALLKHGDSEKGLELLEGLSTRRPDVLENRLRLSEAYLALGDVAPAVPHLCAVAAKKAALRKDDQQLLEKLLRDAQSPSCAREAAPAAGK